MKSRNFKIYIGSSFHFVDECKEISRSLKHEFGVETTRLWWDNHVVLGIKHDQTTFSEFLANSQTRALAECDFQAINESDLVIIYTEDKYKLTGALIELGYALGIGKTVILYGDFKKSAMFARCLHVTDYDDLRRIIRSFTVF